MKYLLYIAVLSCICLSVSAQVMTVVTRNPMPSSLTEWQRDRSLIQVIIVNQAGASAKPNCFIGYILKDASSGKILAQSDNTHPAVPRFTIPEGPSTITRFGSQIINENSSLFDASIRTQVITTNTIPEGSYDFCVTLFDERGVPIGELGDLCRFFSVTIPDPPTLIAPQHQQSIDKVLLPVFSWTPVITTTVNSLYYSIKICPVFEGQNDRFAIDNNPAIHENKRITSTTYMYPASALGFSTYAGAIGFVWQVQALQGNGAPATRNNGKSEIHRFTLKSSQQFFDNNGGSSSSGGVWNESTTFSDNDSLGNGKQSYRRSFRTVRIGEHYFDLTIPQVCDNYCSIKGQLKGKIPFSSDSLLFTSQGLEVRNINNSLVAVKGSIIHQWQRKGFTFKAITVVPKTIVVSQVGNMIDGELSIDWSVLGLRGNNDKLPFKAQWNDEGVLQFSNISQQRFYIENKENNCLYLQLDTVVTSLKFSPSFTLFSHAKASFHLQATPDGIIKSLGTVTLPLDEPNPENLLFTLPIAEEIFALTTTPLTISGKELLIDFSTDVNFSGISVQPQCAALRATNPVWKGIILPEAKVNCILDTKRITFMAKDVILDVSSSLKASFMAASPVLQKTMIGEFTVSVDSAYIALCNNNPLEARFTTSFLLHESGYSIPSSWNIFKQLPLSLYFDGAWKLFGHSNLSNAILEFGGFSQLVLSGAQVRLSKGKYMNEIFSNKVRYSSQVKNLIPFPNFSLSNGNVKMEEGHWKQLPQRFSTLFDKYSVDISEVGLGYDNERFWLGISAELLPPDEAGLTPIPLYKVQVYDGVERKIYSENRISFLRIGGYISSEISLGFKYVESVKDYALTGNGSLTVPWLSRKLPAQFIYGSHGELQFWHLLATEQEDKPVAFLQNCEISALELNLGWNVKKDVITSDQIRTVLLNGGTISSITVPSIGETALYCYGTMLIGEYKAQSFRVLLSLEQSIGTKKGLLGATIQANGEIVIYPHFGFASGTINTQWSSMQKPRELSLLGEVTLTLPEIRTTNIHIQCSQTSSIKGLLGPFNGVIRGISAQNENSMSILQCSQSYWQFSPASLTLRGKFTAFAGISGIPEGQIRPISLIQITTPQMVCLESKVETKDNSTIFNLRFGRNTSRLFASFDALPCLSNVGLLSFSSVKDAITIENDIVTLKTKELGSACDSRTFINVPGSMRTVTGLQFKNSEELVSLRLGDKLLSIPRFLASKPEISGVIDAEYLQKHLRFTLGESGELHCDDKSGSNNSILKKNSVYNLAASLEHNGELINKGHLLPKGTRIFVSILTNENGKEQSYNYPLTLKSPLKTNSVIHLHTLSDKSKGLKVVKMRVQLVDFEESDIVDNCVSDGTSSCE